MSNEIQLVSDGVGLAVIGAPTDVERFFLEQGLNRTSSKDLDLPRLGPILGAGGTTAQVGAELAANAGRWVKLTAESAEAVKKYGFMPTKTPGVSHAMIGRPGEIKQWLQIAQGPGALLSGPLALSALSTIMQQRALQQQMDEIVEYLQEIHEKVDDILRNQKDAVLADMIGVDLIIEEALTVRDEVGRVSEITWSKVQTTSMTIARTQAYALRQLDAIAESLQNKADIGEIAKATKDAEPKIREWLAVLARCFQLQDGISVLELDRVLDASPEDLDRHRLGLATARQNRLGLIAQSTTRLLTQMDEIVRKANSKVLFHPVKSPAAAGATNLVAKSLLSFCERLGIESGPRVLEAKLWSEAAAEVRDKAMVLTAEGAAAAGRLYDKTRDRAADALREVDVDGVPDATQVLSAAKNAGSTIRGLVTGAADTVGSRLGRRRGAVDSSEDVDPQTADGDPQAPGS